MLNARAGVGSIVWGGVALALGSGVASGQVTLNVVNVSAEVGVTNISGNGQTLIGSVGYAFQWSPGAGVNFPPLLEASATSVDGTVLVGSVAVGNFSTRRAAMWVAGSGAQQIPLLVPSDPNAYSVATGVSSDGSVVVGWELSNAQGKAFRWTAAGGTVSLGVPQGSSGTVTARAVSGDGQVVVGEYSTVTLGTGGAFRWTASGGMQNLGLLPGYVFARAFAANADGSVVVGQCETLDTPQAPSRTRAFRWTAADGMQPLGFLDEFPRNNQSGQPVQTSYSSAVAVSADGNVVLARVANQPNNYQLYRWVNGQGTQRIQRLVAESGVTIPPYNNIGTRPGGLSADGTAISTTCFGPVPSGGQNFQGCLIRGLSLPVPSTCNRSDVAGANQAVGPDGTLGADDIIVFLGWFFAADERANVAGANQSTVPDGALSADDIIVFLARYFAGC